MLAKHVKFKDEKLFCTHCGVFGDLPKMPVKIPLLNKAIRTFCKAHAECQMPVVDEVLITEPVKTKER